jgi:sugar lactone lactonase YvrE
MNPGASHSLPRSPFNAQRFSARTPRLLAACALAALALGGCAETAKTVKREYMFWPPAPEVPHIQFLTSISSSADITRQQGKFEELIYGQDPTGHLPFQRPYGIRMKDGQMFVCDATAGNLSVLDFRKNEVRVLGKGAQTNLRKPIDVAIAPDGVKYIADTGLGAVLAYDQDDHYAGKVAVKDMRPVAVAVQDRLLYVSDIRSSCVRVFDRFNGKELRTIGEPGGTTDGKLGGAMGLALDQGGNILVNDVIGCRVQKFNPEGKFLSAIGGLGRNPGSFVRPKLMTVDSDGILYVVDNAFQNVQMFNAQGKMLMYFGGPGRHPGAMSMPTGICVSDTDLDVFAQFVHPAFQAQRLVIVTNNLGGDKINVYALGELKPGKTVRDIAANRSTFIAPFEQPNSGNGVLDLAPDSQLPGDPTTQPSATQPALPAGPPAPAATSPSGPATRRGLPEDRPF